MISGFMIFSITFACVLAMLHINKWTIPSPSASHYYIGVSIFITSFFIALVGFATWMMLTRVEWNTNNILWTKNIHKVIYTVWNTDVCNIFIVIWMADYSSFSNQYPSGVSYV